jgi:formylglycine-generating enzyme required for sulfatase activity
MPTAQQQLSNMTWIPGGTFLMGSADFYPEERPVHRATIGGFWIDTAPVTVADYRLFADATGYLTVGARGSRRRGVHLGRRVRARRPADGQHLAGPVSVAEPCAPTATRGPLRSRRSRPTVTACTT